MRLRPVACAIVALLVSLEAQAQDDVPSTDLAVEADLHFGLGIEAYKASKYDEALEHLLLSNRLVPNRSVIFNIARTWEQKGDFAQAFRYYSDYVRLEDNAERRVAGERAIDRIRDRVALVRIDSDPPGAIVYIDRKNLGARGATPQTLALSPGEHTVLLEREGYVGTTAQVTVAIGESAATSSKLDAVLGSVDLQGTPGAEVRVEGSPDVVGTIPSILRLSPGPKVLVVSAEGYEPKRIIAEVQADKTTSAVADLDLDTGTVVVNAFERDALIEIDGVAKGFTPTVLQVPVGPHRIKVSLPGFRDYEANIAVSHDTTINVDARLRSEQEVTAASRTAQSVEDAPASVSIISREEIKAFAYQSAYDAVAASRGVFQSNDLTYASLGFRGFARAGDYGNRVLTTWDGHTLNDDQLGASYVTEDLSSDLGDINRIELVRGPGSALYGTNAFFGVLNLVTHDGRDVPEPQITVTGDADRRVRGRASAGTGDEDKGVYVSLGGTGAQGRDHRFPELSAETITGAEGSRSATFHTKAWFKSLTFQAYGNTRQKHFATGAFETLPGDPQAVSNDHRAFAELRFEPKLGKRAQLFTRAYVDHYRFVGDYPYEEGYLFSDRWVGTWAGVEPRLVASPTDWFNLTVGAEARVNVQADLYSTDNESDERLLDEQPTQQVFSGYAVTEFKAGKVFTANLGGRFDWFSLIQTPTFNPRASFIVKPGDDDVIKLMGGTAFRAPSPYELFYNDGGITSKKPDAIAPERILTAELEYSHRFDDVTTATGSVFYNNIPRLIDTTVDASDGLLVYGNTNEAVQTLGAEAELRRDWRRGAMVALQNSFNHTRTGDLFGGTPLTNSPAYLVGFKAAAPIVSGISTVSTRLRLGSPRLTNQDTQTPWAVLWDVTLSGDLPVIPVSYGLGVRNLLDWKDFHPGGLDLAMASLQQPGRTFFASLTLRPPKKKAQDKPLGQAGGGSGG